MSPDIVKILENVNRVKLENEINSYLAKDWVLQGNICVNPVHGSLIQVIILKEENRD